MPLHPISARKYHLALALVLLTHFLFFQGHGQTQPDLEKALTAKNIMLADSILQRKIEFNYEARKVDSLNNYVFYVGKITQLKTSTDNALKAVQIYIEKIKKLSPGLRQLRQAYLEAGEYYSSVGKNSLAYKAYQQAHRHTLLMANNTPGELGLVETNLGTAAHRMGDINLSQLHYRNALKSIQADAKPNYKNLYLSYNGMGSIMWYSSKLDSGLYFFNNALEALKKTDSSAINLFYRPAIIYNNLAGIYGVQGKTTDAITAMRRCISHLKEFIGSKEPDLKKNSAITFQFEATDNLGGIYKELGDYKQAQEILTYSYQQKQKHLDPEDPAIFISQILLGQLYFAMKDYDKSIQFLTSGLDKIAKSDGDYLFWQADACYTLALLHDKNDNSLQAEAFFEKADKLYEESLQGEYDNIYLEFLSNAALFYAENKMPKRALAKANKGYMYVNNTEGSKSLLAFYQLLNLTEVHFALGNYRDALSYSKRGLDVVNDIIRSGNNRLDSIKMEIKKPRAILLKAKSEYQLLSSRNPGNLNAILNELNEALHILEKRKAIIRDPKDINLLMADHAELLEFVKKITFDLFKTTGLERYSDRLVSLHESGIYNRIRLRLEKSATSQFAYLPPGLADKERTLKLAMENALTKGGTHNDVMDAYVQAVDNWNQYLDQLRIDHPHYYKMRYASIFRQIHQIQPGLAEEVSFVRYFFVDKVLLALVMDRDEKHIVELGTTALEKHIGLLAQAGTDEKRTADILHNLYQQLWAPIVKYIRHTKVVIIPDGILYNLSFELLTQQKISGFKELATKSILSKHSVSYRYSLFLLEAKSTLPGLDKTFVAFAPGFYDKMKNDYRSTLQDTSDQDNVYLSLLPQPFTISLANRMQEQLNGNSFIYDRSTLSAFRQNAAMHKIIHIGTHAESNNLHPEFSRVIFAKDALKKEENNSLYLFDIYNCQLTSKLTVLTACETGRPGYHDGEGMISLAHAFNYAGSESIITGLWKIDEQASATLMDFFYKNLLDGMKKDEALRQAKLQYLSKAAGRTLAPQYWAGLILMGDTSAIEIKKAGSSTWLIIMIAFILIAAVYVLFRSVSKNARI